MSPDSTKRLVPPGPCGGKLPRFFTPLTDGRLVEQPAIDVVSLLDCIDVAVRVVFAVASAMTADATAANPDSPIADMFELAGRPLPVCAAVPERTSIRTGSACMTASATLTFVRSPWD